MKIKFDNSALISISQFLNKFTSVTGKLGYAISKTKRQIMYQLEPFEEQKYNLFQKYGTENIETKQLEINQDSEKYQKFLNEITPLLQIEVEIDIFQITREELEANESLFNIKDITVEDFDLLQRLFIYQQYQDKNK